MDNIIRITPELVVCIGEPSLDKETVVSKLNVRYIIATDECLKDGAFTYIYHIIHTIEMARVEGGAVLFQCSNLADSLIPVIAYLMWKHNLTLRLAAKYLQVESQVKFRLTMENSILLKEWERERVDGRRTETANKFVAYKVKLNAKAKKGSEGGNCQRFDTGLIGPLVEMKESFLTKEAEGEETFFMVLPSSNACAGKAYIWTNATGPGSEDDVAAVIRLCGKVLHLSRVSASEIEVNLQGAESEGFRQAIKMMNPLLGDIMPAI